MELRLLVIIVLGVVVWLLVKILFGCVWVLVRFGIFRVLLVKFLNL